MLYTIEEETLMSLGDAVRDKSGNKYTGGLEAPNDEPLHTITVDTSTVENWGVGNYYFDIDFNKDILGDDGYYKYGLAKYIYFTLEYEIDDISAFNVRIMVNTPGASTDYYFLRNGEYTENLYIEKNGTFRGVIYKNKSNINGIFTIKIWVCDENKDFIGINKYTSLEMIDEINGLNVLPDEGLVITGSCNYRFANNGWNWFIKEFGDKITTKDISSCDHMFSMSDDYLTLIPFDINCKENTTINLQYMFSSCWHLSRAPKINKCKPYQMSYMFDGCRMLNSFPDDFASDWDWSYLTGLTSSYSGNMNNMFQTCNILRKLPMNLIKYGNSVVNYSYSLYYTMCSGCYNLDEIIGLPFPHYKANWTSNAFNRTFNDCHRLKDMTFEVNEDGTPKIMTWKNQIIDLSVEVGYVTAGEVDISYMKKDETITDANKVIDDATYQTLKDDPNWWATDLNYSRYNRISAVNTINSLPDCSATGTNTIKFKGAQGALTDGGAINTLTEEEIAVATAKGWTVSLV